MSRVKANKTQQTAQQTAKQSVNVDVIAQRTAERARQRTADAQSAKQTAKRTAQQSAKQTRKADAKQSAQRKTAFADVLSAIKDVSAFVTAQDNAEHAYARICFTDAFKRDFYRVCKDFAVYYDRRDSFKISVADSTLTDCQIFKADYKRTEKTRALEFSVKADALRDTLNEIIAQRLLQTSARVDVTEHKQSKARKQSKAKAQQSA